MTAFLKRYEVVVQATITKTLLVQALDHESASQVAYDNFEATPVGMRDLYEETIIRVTEKPYENE